jgi:hypothetical protein
MYGHEHVCCVFHSKLDKESYKTQSEKFHLVYKPTDKRNRDQNIIKNGLLFVPSHMAGPGAHPPHYFGYRTSLTSGKAT